MDFKNIINSTVSCAKHTVGIIKDKSPEILLGLGIGGVLAGTVLACVQTKKVDIVVDKYRDDIVDARTFNDNKKLFKIYTKLVFDLMKHYGWAIACEIAGIACCVGSHGIMAKRNAALAVAYASLSEYVAAFKKEIDDEYGEGTADKINGNLKKKAEEDDPDLVKVRVKGDVISGIYKKNCEGWNKDPSLVELTMSEFISVLQNRLERNGYLTLDEAFKEFDIKIDRKEHPEVFVLGWIYRKDGYNEWGDNYISPKIVPLSDDIGTDYLVSFNVDRKPIVGRLAESYPKYID